MKHILYFSVLVFLSASCKKKPPVPVKETSMQYVDLGDRAILMHHSAQFDINGDGQWDVFFGTLLVGDPIAQVDKWQWLAGSSFNTNLPVDGNERIPMLRRTDAIPINAFPDHGWFNATMVYLTQKIVGMTAIPYWEGDWKLADHHFLPFQIIKDGGLYNGWVEVSFNTVEEKLIVHRAAISKEAGKGVKAGR